MLPAEVRSFALEVSRAIEEALEIEQRRLAEYREGFIRCRENLTYFEGAMADTLTRIGDLKYDRLRSDRLAVGKEVKHE